MFGKCIMGYEYFIYSIDMCLDVPILSVCPQYFKCIFLAFAYLCPVWCVRSIDVG
jgi:hypothetical protein